MRKPLAMTAIAICALAVATSTAQARPISSTHSTWQAHTVHFLRSKIGWNRSMTWHFQDIAGVVRTHSERAELRTTSLPFLRWERHLWVHRRVIARRLVSRHLRARASTASGGVAHWGLWNCIHNGRYPGAPHEGNSSSGTYTGPLQMTAGWDGFPVSNWYYIPIPTVYRDAEIGFARSGYSTSWLEGQWPNTAPPCLGFA